MINAQKLIEAGIDYNAGLSRFMDDLELYETVLYAFSSDNISEASKKALVNHDYETLYTIIHGVKGASGNAGLMALYTETSSLAALLHSKNYTEEELLEYYTRFEKEYIKTFDGVKCALE